MGLSRSQDRFSKSDSRTGEMNYVSKTYFLMVSDCQKVGRGG